MCSACQHASFPSQIRNLSWLAGRRRSEAEIEHAGAAFTCRFLERLHPAIPATTLTRYQHLIKKHEIQVTDLRSLGHEELRSLGFDDVVHNARILTAVNEVWVPVPSWVGCCRNCMHASREKYTPIRR